MTPLSLDTVAETTKARKRAEEDWRKAIRYAARHSSLRTVATFAGVSHARVAQIVKEES